MCVKQAQGCAIAEGDMAPATFAALEPAFPHLEALVLNGIGEPLLHPRLEEFIRRAKKLMPAEGWVGFQSNGLLLTNLRTLSLVEALSTPMSPAAPACGARGFSSAFGDLAAPSIPPLTFLRKFVYNFIKWC